jgi:hypothetical protein
MPNWLEGLWKRATAPSGVTPVDAFIEATTKKIVGVVSEQMNASHATPEQLQIMRSFLLGYVATLAEQAALSSGRADASNAGALISILAAQQLLQVASDPEALLNEFVVYTRERDFAFGQGGALALEDFQLIERGVEAAGLLGYFRASAP